MEMFNDLNELTFTVGSQPKPALANLRNILYSPRFCTLCYETDNLLVDLDEYPFIEELADASDRSLREIITEIFKDATAKVILSSYICNHCKAKLVRTYIFIKNTLESAQSFENYITQLDSETVDLLNCMQEDIPCANAVIVLEEPEVLQEEVDLFKWKSDFPTRKDKVIADQPLLITKSYVCECCQKEFCDKKFLMAHVKARDELCKKKSEKLYLGKARKSGVECPKCKTRPCRHEKFIEYFLYQKEITSSEKNCLECVYVAHTLTALISHAERKHMDTLSDNCELCGKIFHLREQYFSHFDTFHKGYKVCQHCHGVIPQGLYKSHAKQCKETNKPNRCDLCPARFESEMLTTIHSMKHDDVPKKQNNKVVLKRCFTCPLCPLKFDGKIKLQKHISTTHSNVAYRNNTCAFCNIKFNNRNEYLAHLKVAQHLSDIDPNYKYNHKCQYCDYTARHSFILKTHVNRYHLKVMPFQCDICSKQFLDKRKLKAHIDRHMGKSKRVCDLCGDTLGSSTALVKHKRLHTGERPYPCHLCDVSLNSASERKFHVLRKHTEKSHPCPLCETMFHTPYFVRRHIQQVHWKRKEKFDHTKLEGLQPEHYELFRDRRMVVL